MSSFSDFQNILPDPNNTIGSAGQSVGGGTGPGFASVKLSSENKVAKSQTNSGRLIARAIAYHSWKVNISYNPLTRTEFEPVYSFLLHRRGSINPFFVSLPQYRLPQNSTFATYINTHEFLEAQATGVAGATQVTLNRGNYTGGSNGYPSPGDLFNINSSLSSNHKKAYMVTRVETDSTYTGSAPASGSARIHFTPGLQKAITSGDDFVFKNPLIKVVARDTQEYSLNTNNLYSFSLNLEEVQ